ncbi:MAG: winged helix-turn-helix transcriptional regulator [Nitrososphaerales archaeon]
MPSISYDGDSPPLEGTRAVVYEYIMKHPGTHIREIRKDLGLGMGDLQYHIYTMEKLGMIKTIRRGLYKFVFASNLFADKQTAILSALSLESEREILLYLSQRPGLTQLELAQLTRLSPPTILWHMGRLIQQGIVDRKKTGKFVNYFLSVDAQEIQGFIKNYHTAFWETLAGRLAEMFLTLSIKGVEVEKNEDDGIDVKPKDDG